MNSRHYVVHAFGGDCVYSLFVRISDAHEWTTDRGECQGSCRLNYVMIPPIDEAAVLAA